ncbi:pyridoxamine kinase [Dipodascopsis uninucleata]
MTCITALTAQNTLGVSRIVTIDKDFVGEALDAIFTDVGVDAVKTGMLASAETISTVSKRLSHYSVKYIVVDPVMISTSGSQLLPDSAVSAYITDLFPIAYMITPNLQEGKFLYHVATGSDATIESLEDAKTLAKELFKLGPKYVLLKGGHLPLSSDHRLASAADKTAIVADILYDGESYQIIESSYIFSKNTHGTGCTLSAAIASNLSLGKNTIEAVKDSIAYVHGAIAANLELGKGNGPIDHLHNLFPASKNT